MPGSNKTERNRKLKANRQAGIGDADGRIPVRVKDAGIMMVCIVCKSELKCTKTNTELKQHAVGKHGKANYEECFPGAEVHARALMEKVTKGGAGAGGKGTEKQGLSKAEKKKKAAAGLDDLLSAGVSSKPGKKKGR
mmetsp:Transcript_29952/g.55065  ORF Transcript_29952/g.55065 Transcript_29952/m.55065 type:complete len:137 (-) Transcript_29952:218-628(-)|eukprot:CAMPEP_0201612726 /NCGR_PEP_ID=MMETSP0492-20130828/23913_1 /ASSEMBLY_ACC=CAM_ASM_000837 /TAXON_ID=420259 /ORGANISM="Thalassiosira gravida, Strain GMp14c1" /LENGTH=136 /DNA_ID=CAMNT_0048079339 /DNA_START=31 /DNA_END=441 /DNA_ORIENTATION=-